MYFRQGRYWGRLLKVFIYGEENDNAERVEINFFHKKCESWDFSSKEDQQVIEILFHGAMQAAGTHESWVLF